MSIFLLASSFYLYEFILQVAPAVMADSMMRTFKVTAEGFGIVSAFYFYAYAPMQMPAGLLFDRYGPRKLMTFALLLCAAGSFFFASTDSVLTASLGRFLIGMGSAFSFIGVLVLTSRWFAPQHFAILAGIAQLMSSVGAIFGEMPLAKLTEVVGWRNASFILAAIGVVLALLLWCKIRDYPHQTTQSLPERPLREEWKRLLEIWRHAHTWITGLYAFCIWTPIAVFAALWGVPYLQTKYGLSVVMASGLCSMIWIGIGVGSPLLGWVSDVCKSRRLALAISAMLGLIATILLLYVPSVSMTAMYAVLFMLGLGAGGQTVSFAVVKENNPPHLVGTASGFNNLSVLLGAAIFQPLVGVLLHRGHDWTIVNGLPVYTLMGYNKALLVMPLCFLVSLIVSVFIMRESHPEHRSRI
ncbi:major facilitator family transporter [Legionella geestiana]|uniref:Lysosomal dipeptide transporter MFSD1 n=1 Tax=Legionella geestiana TaxID=45065 RepID=A0A0W0TPH8_9GAMM|nr:MFS transporter [Legionella geestiana]KTC97462.1 major facilitator family transporter [Legionella geestiana]QBS13331.1 MFS transporter [Legionella geestiana]QDQ40930.1 MFS transporter [Legionella geestiana]STX54139.1 major facilitator family transporter [Legionella geestiana]